jgi:hypothetical protein
MESANVDESVVTRLMNLHPQEILRNLLQTNPVKAETDFDPNTYFSILTHLSMKTGYVLDYVYRYHSLGGEPWLYARLVDETPLVSITNYWERGEKEEFRLLPFLVADGSTEGFFQLVVFLRLAGQFYLFWHSCYKDLKILTSPTDIQTIISKDQGTLTEEQIAELMDVDPRPTVEVAEDRAFVTYCTFSNWGGLQQYKDCFSVSPPHFLVKRQLLNEINYDCGIRG